MLSDEDSKDAEDDLRHVSEAMASFDHLCAEQASGRRSLHGLSRPWPSLSTHLDLPPSSPLAACPAGTRW